MTELARLCLKAISPARARLQRQYLPLMEINFVESNPIPVKAAMGLMGLLEPVYRLPLVAAPASNLEDRTSAGIALGSRRRRCPLIGADC